MRGGYLRRVVFISIFWTCTIVTLFAIYAFGPQILELFNLGSGNLAHIGYGSSTCSSSSAMSSRCCSSIGSVAGRS